MAREALAFDMYGTLVDPIRIWKLLEQYITQSLPPRRQQAGTPHR